MKLRRGNSKVERNLLLNNTRDFAAS